MEENGIPESAMVIVAHPDDIEFGCAGTIARWTQTGSRIAYVLCTSGEVGIAEEGMTKEKAAEIREKEQLAAAKIIGVEDVTFLREPDGMLQPTLELRKKLVREIRRFKPEIVVCDDRKKTDIMPEAEDLRIPLYSTAWSLTNPAPELYGGGD